MGMCVCDGDVRDDDVGMMGCVCNGDVVICV